MKIYSYYNIDYIDCQYKILKIIQKPLKNYKCYVTIIDNKISMVKNETKP